MDREPLREWPPLDQPGTWLIAAIVIVATAAASALIDWGVFL